MIDIRVASADIVRQFQSTHLDWEGKWLKVDGDPGPKTYWAWQISQLETWRQDVVARACSRVGVVELDTNSGPEINAWLKRSGANPGDPWCACFASWCISVAGLPDVRIAGAQALGKSLAATQEPLPGDVMWFPTGPWQGHCGIVIAVGQLETASVEGNLGNEVALARRVRNHCRYGTPKLPSDPPRVDVPPGLRFKDTSIVGTR